MSLELKQNKELATAQEHNIEILSGEVKNGEQTTKRLKDALN